MSSRGTYVTRRLGSAQSSLLALLEGLGFLDADSLLRLPTIGVSARERRDNLSECTPAAPCCLQHETATVHRGLWEVHAQERWTEMCS